MIKVRVQDIIKAGVQIIVKVGVEKTDRISIQNVRIGDGTSEPGHGEKDESGGVNGRELHVGGGVEGVRLDWLIWRLSGLVVALRYLSGDALLQCFSFRLFFLKISIVYFNSFRLKVN